MRRPKGTGRRRRSLPRRAGYLLLGPALAGFGDAASQEAETGSEIADATQGILAFLEPEWRLAGGGWPFALGRVSPGDEKRLSFPVEAGRDYRVVGAGAGSVLDLDICVFDAEGESGAATDRAVGCDVLPDPVPAVEFAAAGSGSYEAVLTAIGVDGSSSYAGMAVFERRLPADLGTGDASPYDLTTVTTLGVLTSLSVDGWDFVPGSSDWGLVLGTVSEGESKRVRFDVDAGRAYQVSGAGAAAARDLDICVFDDMGEEVACDTDPDAAPRVVFTAGSSGSYAASLVAHSMAAPGEPDTRDPVSARAGLVLSIRGSSRCDAWRMEPDYFVRATVLDVKDCVESWTEALPVDARLGTPLLLAARDSKDSEMIDRLFDIPGLDTFPDHEGHTPLHMAVLYSPVAAEAAGLLLDHNPDLLTARDSAGATPLHLAVGRTEVDMDAIDRLLAEAATQDRADSTLLAADAAGNTPLHIAAATARRPVVVRRLVEGEYTPRPVRARLLTATNLEDKTPVELAAERKGGGGVALQLEGYDAEYVNPSLSRRAARVFDAMQPVLASGGALILFLFTYIRTFPNSRIARGAHRIFNNPATEDVLDD